MRSTDERDHLSITARPEKPSATVLLLHGGAEHGDVEPRPWSGPVLRMRPFGWAIRRRRHDLAIAALRFRRRGWNGAAAHPLHDVTAAIQRLRAAGFADPFVLVGHSMGGRAAIGAAGTVDVCGVVALAPWLPRDESTAPLAGRALVIIHGDHDRRTSPEASRRFAQSARRVATSVEYITIPRGGHAMVRSARLWHRATADAVAAMVPPDPGPSVSASEVVRGS